MRRRNGKPNFRPRHRPTNRPRGNDRADRGRARASFQKVHQEMPRFKRDDFKSEKSFYKYNKHKGCLARFVQMEEAETEQGDSDTASAQSKVDTTEFGELISSDDDDGSDCEGALHSDF